MLKNEQGSCNCPFLHSLIIIWYHTETHFPHCKFWVLVWSVFVIFIYFGQIVYWRSVCEENCLTKFSILFSSKKSTLIWECSLYCDPKSDLSMSFTNQFVLLRTEKAICLTIVDLVVGFPELFSFLKLSVWLPSYCFSRIFCVVCKIMLIYVIDIPDVNLGMDEGKKKLLEI